MNAFESALIAILGEQVISKIHSVKIGIAGAGGLGSNCAVHLVRSGFKWLRIVDFDRIDYTNLNRQFYFYNQVGKIKVEALRENLLSINPDVNIESINTRIDKNNVHTLFECCDVIVEALDQAVDKKMMLEQLYSTKKLLIGASGLAGWGQSDDIRIHHFDENIYIIGDLVSEVGKMLPPMAPRVNVAAAKQADIILSHILK